MRYRLPEGCSAVSFDGKRLEIAGDRTVALDARAAAALEPHGLTPAPAPGREGPLKPSNPRSTR